LASILRISIHLGKFNADHNISSRLFYGWGINEIAERCLSPVEDLRLALRRHTGAPFLLALRKESYATELEDSLVRGFRPKTGVCVILPVCSSTRRCPMCMAEDLSSIGVACARVIHQLVGVAHCPVHNVPLQQACASCGKEFEELFAKAGRVIRIAPDLKRCIACRCTEGVNLSPPKANVYRIYVDLLVGASGAQAWLLRPAVRLHLVEAAMARIVADGLEITSVFADEWGAGSFEEAAALCGASPKWLKHALNGTAFVTEPAAALMALAFSLSLLASRKIHYVGIFCDLEYSIRPAKASSDTLSTRLWRLCREHGIPTFVIDRISEGSNWINISTSSGLLRSLVNELSTADLHELNRRRAEAHAKNQIRRTLEGRHRTLFRAQVLTLVRRIRKKATGLIRFKPKSLGEGRNLYQWMLANDNEWFGEYALLLHSNLFVETWDKISLSTSAVAET
jgi:hypothetical protein